MFTRDFVTVRLITKKQDYYSSVSQSVSYFTVPPRAHPSTGSQSGSATPGLTHGTEYSLPAPGGLLNCRK